MTPAAEAALTGAGGAALGALAGLPLGVPLLGAAIGGANGAVSGWRGIYDWGHRQGWAAFAADSTWALLTTGAGLASHAVAVARGRADYLPSLSTRRNRHVYGRGLVVRRGFAVTMGNVVSGVGEVDPSTPRGRHRQHLVDRHEDVHVWQARLLGPLYPLAYVGWMGGAGVVGTVVALARRQPVATVVETLAYYDNPLEWWAYSHEGRWPPARAAAGLVWRRPAPVRASAGSPAARH